MNKRYLNLTQDLTKMHNIMFKFKLTTTYIPPLCCKAALFRENKIPILTSIIIVTDLSVLSGRTEGMVQ